MTFKHIINQHSKVGITINASLGGGDGEIRNAHIVGPTVLQNVRLKAGKFITNWN